jgi:NAD-dependent SIR2 family protein deacetylase
VTFFGDVVPAPKVDEAFARVAEADAILVAGTSLMVYSGWRFVLDASKRGTKIAVVNVGHTRAEKEGVEHLKLEASCGDVLKGACEVLAGAAASGP